MPHPAPYRIRSAIAWLLAGCAAFFAAWKSGTSQSPAPSADELSAYYAGSVSPLLDAAELRDREAANAALSRLHDHFQQFHAGIPAFADDITGWGTRFGIVGRSVKDLWTKFWDDPATATATKDYVNTKFRAHIVSEVKLQRAVTDALTTFRDSVAANHNRMLSEVKLALSMPECPVRIPSVRLDGLLHNAASSAGDLAVKQGGDNVLQTAALLAGGVAADMAATRMVAALFARLAATTAATIATEGTAAAGATATGGAAGTAAGPVGTVIGIGVGIVASVIMDWWMTDSFKTKLHEQCGGFLSTLEREITAGNATAPGLRKALEDSAAANHAAFRKSLSREFLDPLP